MSRRRRRHRIRRWWKARQSRWDRFEIAVESGHRLRCQAETGQPCRHLTVTEAQITTNPANTMAVIQKEMGLY